MVAYYYRIILSTNIYVFQVSDTVKDLMHKTIKDADHIQAWNDVQLQFKCCGIYNYTDWYENPNYNATVLPKSCCASPPCNSTNVWTRKGSNDGCLTEFVEWLRDHIYYVGAVGIAFAIIQVGLTLSSTWL